jgi:hypothetical protein
MESWKMALPTEYSSAALGMVSAVMAEMGMTELRVINLAGQRDPGAPSRGVMHHAN